MQFREHTNTHLRSCFSLLSSHSVLLQMVSHNNRTVLSGHKGGSRTQTNILRILLCGLTASIEAAVSRQLLYLFQALLTLRSTLAYFASFFTRYKVSPIFLGQFELGFCLHPRASRSL